MAGWLVALLLTHAYVARAGEIVSGDAFTSGTSVEYAETGDFDWRQSDGGDHGDRFYWSVSAEGEIGRVSEYLSGEAYDYGAHGLVRNAFLDADEPYTNQYLALATEVRLDRAIFGRADPEEDFSNVVVRTGTRDSIYCDMVVQFTPGEQASYDDTARLVVWARVLEDDSGDSTTNLIVTAGCFTNRFTEVVPRDYVLDCEVDLSRWYRLTIRAHGDVSRTGEGLAGFSVSLDGEPVRAVASGYAICAAADRLVDWQIPEARALVAERRFFPSLARPSSDKSFTISGLSFLGEGQVDDVTFSSKDPGFAAPEAVFTLNWDNGFQAPLSYSLDGGLTTNAVPVETARRSDILIGSAPTNGLTLKVTEWSYREDLGFLPGVWLGSNGATLTNGSSFVYDGTTRNPIATVASTRNVVSVGPGGSYDTFKSAIDALDKSTNAVKVLSLATNVLVSVSKEDDAYGNRDAGYVDFSTATGRYVLDLDGHTLRGQGRKPTLNVRCAALRVCDSSLGQTGRILPVDTYLNPTSRLNTSVNIYPNMYGGLVVEPVVTLEAGAYDGWVRNDGSVYLDTALTGVVFVEGGSYISTNALTFYLESSVTNTSMQFGYRDGYWSCLATNAVIWTGLGDGLRWTDPKNWKGLAIPKSGETAFFPSRASDCPPWTVDLGSGKMSTKRLWLENDVRLSGTNDFVGVQLESSGSGRFCGDATLEFEGEQPGRLTETMLRDDWAGTVVLRKYGTSAPKVLKNVDTWGTASSTVVFNGVNGYVMDTVSRTLPYAFVLRNLVADGKTYVAWQNNSGYTGSTLAFTGALSGDGTLQFGSNLRAILQLFKFADVREFRGKFDVKGKRVLVGPETVMASSAGLIAFGDHAIVTTGLGWSCKRALFGSSLHLWGATNDVLVTCTGTQPDVTGCTNVTLNGHADVAWLACTNQPKWTVYVTGTRPSYLPVASFALASAAPLAVFAAAPVAVAADDGYSQAALQASEKALAAASVVTAVESADVSLELTEGSVVVVVANAVRGLWYGIRRRASLADAWSDPVLWLQATGETVTLPCAKEGDSGFFEVVVTSEEPSRTGGGAGD